MDVTGALVGLVALSPLLLFVAVWIKCVSRGPAFFRQQRFGLAGRPFVVWKFRTMETNDAEEKHRSHVKDLMSNDRPLVKCDGKMRIIRGGRVIRQLGLDELPQLINVLAGEMSLVGPRPDVVPLDQYQDWQRCRFDVLPGITGLWQVSGKNQTTFSTMMKLDTTYVRRRSLWLDLAILVKTIPAVMSD
jgi:lipopolysaccharide/colanic/teichoic acid biosynthesis glycosyltransferase